MTSPTPRPGFVRAWLERAGLESPQAKPAHKRRVMWLARILVLLLVAWGLSRHFTRLSESLDWSRVSLDLPTLLLGGGLYAAGMSLVALYFGLVLRDVGAGVGIRRGMAVWWASQVGKYVPGKMMVVVLRCAMLRPLGVSRITSAIASFYETPAFMAAGALSAGLWFLAVPAERFSHRATFLPIAWVFALVLACCIAPPVYRRLAATLARPFRTTDEPPSCPSWRSLALVPLLLLPAWGMIGASLIACASGLSREEVPSSDWSLLVAAAAAGVVAGFVVVVSPSGIGVREWVIVEALAPVLGTERALAATLALRALWLAVEVLVGLVSYGWVKACRSEPDDASPSSSPP